MFAYCLNNPVSYSDQAGQLAHYSANADKKCLDDNWASGYGGGGAVLIGIVELVEDAAAFISTSAIAIAIQTAQESSNDHGQYVVYVLVDQKGSIQYTGRTRNPIAREKAHKGNPYRGKMRFEIVGANLNYNQARGLEQVLMLYYHTFNAQDPKNNQINGIRLTNESIEIYIDAAKGILGYTWNQLSNEVLNWLGQ